MNPPPADIAKTPSIFEHFDLPSFYRAHAEAKREASPRWSYGVWARQLGLANTSAISRLLKGERTPGARLQQKIIAYFQFDAAEAAYFRDLAAAQKLGHRDPEIALQILQKVRLEYPTLKIAPIDPGATAMIAHWYSLAVRELTVLPGFVEDAEQIASRLRYDVTAKQVTEIIANLLAAGLLERDARGALRVPHQHVRTSSDVPSLAIRAYHAQTLDIAKRALLESPIDRREFEAVTLRFDLARMAEAKQLIREFRARFTQLFEGDAGAEVYQMQMQFFPLTRRSPPAQPPLTPSTGDHPVDTAAGKKPNEVRQKRRPKN